jgi:hypothetical protein
MRTDVRTTRISVGAPLVDKVLPLGEWAIGQDLCYRPLPLG